MTPFLARGTSARTPDVQRWMPPSVNLETEAEMAAVPVAPTSEEIQAIEEMARRAGAEAGFREGYEAGYREGREQAAQEAEDERREREARELQWRAQEERTLQATVAALEGIAHALADPLASSADALEPELLVLVSTLARRVVVSELATRPELIERVLHEALQQLPSRKHELRIQVNPDDQRILEAYASAHGESVTWIADPAVEPGGCLLISGPSRIDASLEARLRQGIDAIWGELTPPVSGDDATPAPAASDPVPPSGQAPISVRDAASENPVAATPPSPTRVVAAEQAVAEQSHE